MTPDGYSIVRLANNVELQHFPSNAALPETVTIVEASLAVHCPALGWEDEEGLYRLVQRFRDFAGTETRTQKLGPPVLDIDGNSLVVSRDLVAKSEEEIAAWDAAQLAEDMALQCTRSQFMLAALELGKLDTIEGFIDALDPQEPAQREIIIRFREAPTFYRNFPGWDQMAPQIGETASSVTALFRLALTK